MKDKQFDQISYNRQIDGSSPVNGGGRYEITVEGHLDDHWSEVLGGLTISHDDEGITQLRGAIPDQAALHGILAQIRDLGITLISVVPMSDVADG